MIKKEFVHMPSKEDTTPNVKQQIISAAIQLVAENGYYKTTTTSIANAVGVSQPYLFHFFKKKEDLYLTVLDQAKQRVIQTFKDVNSPPSKLKESMGNTFNYLLDQHRNEILLAMTTHTIAEPVIREAVRNSFDEVHESLRQKFKQAGFPNPRQEANYFLGEGLLIALAETINLPKLLPKYR